MSRIEAIIFDLGNVLINFDWGVAEKNLDKIKQNLGNHSQKYFRDHPELIIELEKGQISDLAFLEKCRLELEFDCSSEELAKIFSQIFSPNQELIDKLKSLAERVDLYLLSNTNAIHKQYGWGDFNFIKYFKQLFLSYQIGFVKPEVEIYKYVEERINLDRESFIYIDDILDYVSSAANLGWNAIHFENNQSLMNKLKEYKVLQ